MAAAEAGAGLTLLAGVVPLQASLAGSRERAAAKAAGSLRPAVAGAGAAAGGGQGATAMALLPVALPLQQRRVPLLACSWPATPTPTPSSPTNHSSSKHSSSMGRDLAADRKAAAAAAGAAGVAGTAGAAMDEDAAVEGRQAAPPQATPRTTAEPVPDQPVVPQSSYRGQCACKLRLGMTKGLWDSCACKAGKTQRLYLAGIDTGKVTVHCQPA